MSRSVFAAPALLRILGLSFGIAVVVGGVVGQGIMRTPGIVAGALPSAQLILAAWLFGGLLALIDSFASIELATSLPRAGGPYVFATRAFGSFTGTMIGWTDWLNGTIVLGFLSVVFAEYVHRLAVLEDLPIRVLALLLVGVVWLINSFGTRGSGLSQNIGSAFKALALIFLIAIFFAAPVPPHVTLPVTSPAWTLSGFVVAMRVIYNTYSGWNTAVYFSEEVHSPGRNIVRATFSGLAIITLLYVAMIAALLRILRIDQIAASALPAAEAARVVLGDTGEWIITALAIISVAAIANLYAMFVTRIAYGMARDEMMPAPLARVAPSGTPQFALCVTVLAGALFASTGIYEHLIAMSVPLAVTITHQSII